MRRGYAQNEFWRGAVDGIPPIPALKPSEWFADNFVFSGDNSAIPGRAALTNAPYQLEAMDDAVDESVVESVDMWASQLGKSTVMNSVHGFFMHADPSPQLHVQPTIDLAKAYSTERIAPMIRDIHVLRRIVRDPRARNSGNTILAKVYPGGSLVFAGANSPAGLAGRPRRVVLQDEIDRFPSSAGTEGDPCMLADKRCEAFPNCVKMKTSTPTTKGESRIENLLEQSDFQKWHVCCPRCSCEQVLMWKQIVWPENNTKGARLKCEGCGAELTDQERVQMVRAGKWKATKPFNGIRGRWLNGLNTTFKHHKGYVSRLHQFAEEFLKAKAAGKEGIRVWTNTFLAETYEEDTDVIVISSSADKTEPYSADVMPEQIQVLTAGVDVQENRIEVIVDGWARDDERFGIMYEILDGDPEKDEVWSKLDNLLLRKFTREDGVEFKIERALIDAGYKSPRVLSFCGPRIERGVFPCKGLNRASANPPPLIPAKPSRNNRARIPMWLVGVTVAKTAIYDRLKLETPGPRTMHYSAEGGFDDLFFKGLTIEKRKKRYAYGKPYFIFEKDNEHQRNEPLDISVYSLSARETLGRIVWDDLARYNISRRPKRDEASQVQAHVENQQQKQPEQNTQSAGNVSTNRIRKRGLGIGHRWI